MYFCYRCTFTPKVKDEGSPGAGENSIMYNEISARKNLNVVENTGMKNLKQRVRFVLCLALIEAYIC